MEYPEASRYKSGLIQYTAAPSHRPLHALSAVVCTAQRNVEDQVRLQVLKGVGSVDVTVVSRSASKLAAKEMVAETKRQAEIACRKADKKWQAKWDA